MTFIIFVVGLALFTLSQADIYNKGMNIIMWDGLAEFYNSDTMGADVDPLSDKTPDQRYRLCSAVGHAAQFIFTSTNDDAYIISGGFVTENSGSLIQTKAVLIGDMTAERTIMLCELLSRDIFYLEEGSHYYYIFTELDTNQLPKLRAAAQFVLSVREWQEGPADSVLYPLPEYEYDANGCDFDTLPVVGLLNICASIHRYNVNEADNEKSYTLTLDSDPTQGDTTIYFKTENIGVYVESRYNRPLWQFSWIPIQLATCHVYSYEDNNSEIIYRISPHRTEEKSFYLLGPHPFREEIEIKVKLTFW